VCPFFRWSSLGSLEPIASSEYCTRKNEIFDDFLFIFGCLSVLTFSENRFLVSSCLDRTNVAQFSAGVEAVKQQLVVMGIRSHPKLDPSSNIVRVLIDMYVDIGDHIALQYGGSEAHKKVSTERSESIVGPIGKHKELLTSIRRYYSNAFTDRLKQDAMNLFLGYYVPYRHTVPLWEMESDYYLHSVPDVFSGNDMLGYQRRFGVLDWNNDDDKTDNGTDMKSSVRRTTNNRLGSRDMVSSLHPSQSRRINNVRRRCENQNAALSLWWKIAIHSYVQQRMVSYSIRHIPELQLNEVES
jgi:hypothetical protein